MNAKQEILKMATKYRIEQNDLLGRYLVASTDIKAGDTILSEQPTLLGSHIDSTLRCFNCYKTLGNRICAVCPLCNAALLCKIKCVGKFHTTDECKTLKEYNVNRKLFLENQQVIFPLRCLLLKKKPEMWSKIMQLEHHCGERRGTPIWERNEEYIVPMIRNMSLLTEEELADELVQKVCGILDVNTFEVRPPAQDNLLIKNAEFACMRGLYLDASLMAHDCVGNTFLSVDDDFTLRIKASVDILENSPIFFNYVNALSGSDDRREHLRVGKYFDCSCKRCKDPTELGTYLSSLKCSSCRKGIFVRENPENGKSYWICTDCKKKIVSNLVTCTVEEARRKIQELDSTNIVKLEEFLNKLLLTFHSNHYLLVELKQTLIGFYVRIPPTMKNLTKKIKLCDEVLEVVSKLEPGISRTKAMTLYQLQSAQVDLTNRLYRDGEINQNDFICKLREAESNLKEAIQYLLYEPMNSPEGKIAQMAMSELKMLRVSIQNIFKDCALQDLQGDRNKGDTSEGIPRNNKKNRNQLLKFNNKKYIKNNI